MVSQRSIGTGLGFSRSGLRALTGTAKPRLAVTSDFMVTMPTTRPCMIEHRTAAVALLDRHGDLQHGNAVDVAPAGEHAGDHAVLEPLRMAQGHDGLAGLERVGVAQWQRLEVLGVDLHQGQVEVAIGGVDGNHLVLGRRRRAAR